MSKSSTYGLDKFDLYFIPLNCSGPLETAFILCMVGIYLKEVVILVYFYRLKRKKI